MSPRVSVVIPAYNEEQRLGPSLEAVLRFLNRRDESWEVVVVDDGSSDDTAAVAARFSERGVRTVRLAENRGKGHALRRGVEVSQGAMVLLTDADLSTPITEMETLQTYLGDVDVVLGSRAVSGARITVHQPIYRELMGKTFNGILRLLGVTSFRDTQCGFKLLRGDVARRLFAEMTVDRFAYDVELVFLAEQRGYRVCEVGVEWADSPASKVSPVLDSAQMFWDVLRLRLRHRRRRSSSGE